MAKAPATPRKAAPAKAAPAKAVKAAAPPVAKAEAAVTAAGAAATEAPAQAAEAHQAATGFPPPDPPGGDPVTLAARAAEETMTASAAAAAEAHHGEPEQIGEAPHLALDPGRPIGLIPPTPDGTAEEMLRLAAVQLACVGMTDAAQFLRRMCVVAEAAATALLRRNIGTAAADAGDGFEALDQHLKTSIEAYVAMNKAALTHARDALGKGGS